jgi:hypothetical protein
LSSVLSIVKDKIDHTIKAFEKKIALFTPDVLCSKYRKGGAGIQILKDRSFILITMANTGSKMMDFTNAAGKITAGLLKLLTAACGETPS